MKFKPLSKDELKNGDVKDLLPDGEYKFFVLRGDLGESKAGNQMLTVKIEIFSQRNGVARAGAMDSHHIYDYILPEHPSMGFKLAQFMDCIAMGDQYSSGNLEVDTLTGKSGTAQIGTQQASGDWPAKNVIKRYVPPNPFDPDQPKAAPTDEEIPF